MARSIDPPGPDDLATEWGRYGIDPDKVGEITDVGTPLSIIGDMAAAGPSDTLVYFGQEDDPIGVKDFFAHYSDDYLLDSGFDAGTGTLGAGYGYVNRSGAPLVSTVDKTPAPITVAPTSTSNPDRPRTVAAGYDPARRVLTVILRDSTFYSYYEVSLAEWTSFKRARSKGVFIRLYLDGHPRGTADVSSLPMATQEVIYRVARTVQVMREGAAKRPTKIGGGRASYGVRKGQEQFTRRYTTAAGKAKTVTTSKPKWQGAPSAFYARYGSRFR